MPESINWIHLSDLHLGLDNHSWLWPRVKNDLFRDLEKIGHEIDAWDLIFFTGDLTQSGAPAEFDKLNKELEELWNVLSKKGRTPLLCVIPGNHDLLRPPIESAVVKALTRLWWSDNSLRRSFWSASSGEYRDAVRRYFASYLDWYEKTPIPKLQISPGALPGDFSAIFRKNGVELGVVGLNSTFLQISEGDFKGKLDLHVSQMSSACGGDPVRWTASRTATVLLTHHPPSWLAPEALTHFKQELYPSGRFLAHYCGHLHEPEMLDVAEAGGAPRRTRQGTSLFGLEEWSGPDPRKRHHGYSAGQFVFEVENGYEKLWPRTTMKARDGGLNLCPDHTYKLLEGDFVVTPFETHQDPQYLRTKPRTDTPKFEREAVGRAETHSTDATLFGRALDSRDARTRLATCPRISLVLAPQHQFVRQEEQSQFELALRSRRCVWLVADWGTGKDGFLGAALHRFRSEENGIEAFHLRCDEVSDVESLEALFSQQFGLPLQKFCTFAAPIKNSFLFFDELHPALCTPEGTQTLKQIIGVILDYCPDLSVVVSSRRAPDDPFFDRVALRPLEAPDVRAYVTNHPDGTPELQESEIVEKLHERSDGLPMHLDRMLSALRVSSLSTVLDGSFEFDMQAAGMSGETSRALAFTVSGLSRSRDKRTKRSFRLLKVLAVLPYGETLDTLHHYLPEDSFFEENAIQLNDLALLDVIPLFHSRADMSMRPRQGAGDIPKVLKVPRQVRDYVHVNLSAEEREAILLAGMERFFGRRWREGIVKARALTPDYQAFIASGVGNEFAVVSQLLRCTDKSEDITFTRILEVGLQYARHLNQANRYRDLSLVAGALIKTFDSNSFPAAFWELTGLLGKGLRMIGKTQEGLVHLRDSLEFGNEVLSAGDKAMLWINVAYAEISLGNKDDAVTAADEARRFAKPSHSARLESEYVRVCCLFAGEERQEALRSLATRSKKSKNVILSENISLELAKTAALPEKTALLNSVLANKTRAYNQQRAIVAKASALQDSNDSVALSNADIGALVGAYSYLHSQRFGNLFDQCHEALWRAFEIEGNTANLLKLFRYSSFVWRIRGEEEKESASLTRLSERGVQDAELPSSARGDLATKYFWLRMRVVNLLLVNRSNAASNQT
jgi:hypothetical protein